MNLKVGKEPYSDLRAISLAVHESAAAIPEQG